MGVNKYIECSTCLKSIRSDRLRSITYHVLNQINALYVKEQLMVTFRFILINVGEKHTIVMYVERNLIQVSEEQLINENVYLQIKSI